MTLYAGIDGGQSSTVAIIADEHGNVLGRGSAGGCDEIGADPASTRLRDALSGALLAAAQQAQLPEARFTSVVAGISGYEGTIYGVAPALNTDALLLVHDTQIAHAGAFGGDHGVIVIAGTGSVAYGTCSEGPPVLIGGWGYLFGDEGSAFWIARRALERAMLDEDAGLRSVLRGPALEHFRRDSLRALSRDVYVNAIPRAQVATFAPLVLSLAAQSDDARFIVSQAADALAALAASCARRLHGNRRVIGVPVQVAFCGGLFEHALFGRRVIAQLADRLPEATVIPARHPPETGALMLAYREVGATIPPGLS